MGWRYCKARQRELPRVLRRPRLANLMARKYYRAKPYPGDAVLFQAEVLNPWMHQDAHEAWKGLVTGNLEIIDVSGAHLDLIKEPHVAELACKLDRVLTEAQGVITP
jgi:thioesterase domain-containing protein